MNKTELNKISISNVQEIINNAKNKKVLDIVQKNIINEISSNEKQSNVKSIDNKSLDKNIVQQNINKSNDII